MREFARFVRHAPDRILHPLRRRSALARVDRNRPNRVLCVCLGNICRSPYAEQVLRRSLPGREIRSAGFLAGGRPSPAVAIEAGAGREVDLSRHLSVQLGSELLEWAELIVVMDRRQARRIGSRLGPPLRATLVEVLGDFDPAPIGKRVIPDPFGREREFFDEVYRRVEACCATLSGAFPHDRSP